MSKLAAKQISVVEAVRSQIVTGLLSPGSQIPTLDELESQFDISRMTAARVVKILKKDGFIHSVGKTGCYVSDSPPHLSRYGLVFPRRSHLMVPRGWQLLAQEALAAKVNDDLQIVNYNIGQWEDSESELNRLLDDMNAQRLAGVIFDWTIDESVLKVMRNLPIPKVSIDANNKPRPHQEQFSRDMRLITLDYNSFREKAIAWLASQGCRRVAAIGGFKAQVTGCQEILRRRGIATQPYWMLSTGFDEPERARDVARLLFCAPEHERPDGLIVADDNLQEYVTAGVMEAGIRVPDQLKMVFFNSWPSQLPCTLPVKGLGFSMRATLLAAINTVDALRRGEEPPMEQLIPAVFEDELEARG